MHHTPQKGKPQPPKEIMIISFLKDSQIQTDNPVQNVEKSVKQTQKDVDNLVDQLSAGLPEEYKNLQIILVTKAAFVVSRRMTHQRVKTVLCPEHFSPKNNVDYILVETNCVDSRNAVLSKFGKNKHEPLHTFKLEGDGNIQKIDVTA